jgi:hypothetical protein
MDDETSNRGGQADTGHPAVLPSDTTSRTRLVIHLGFHKTASSFLQSSLYASATERVGGLHVLPNGFGVLNAAATLTKRHRFLRLLETADQASLSVAEADMRSLIWPFRDGVLLTNENLLGDQLGQSGSRLLYPLAVRVLEFFDRLSDSYSVEYVFYVRNQAEFIESSYLNLVRDGYGETFDEYLRSFEIDSLDYARFFKKLADETRNVITVIPYEIVKSTPDRLLNSMCELLGGNLSLVPSTNTRPSLSYVGLEIALRSFPLLNFEERRLLSEFLAENFSSLTHEKMMLFELEEKTALRSRFAASNAALFRDYISPIYHDVLAYYV